MENTSFQAVPGIQLITDSIAMNTTSICSITLFLLTSLVRADHFDLSVMRRYAITDQFGEYLFIMAPKQGNGETLPHGTAYSIEVDGTIKELWSVSGWYEEPTNVFLDQTGRYLVRITEPPEMNKNSEPAILEEKTVLSFFDKGKLIKDYKLKDIVHDVRNGVSPRFGGKTFVFGRPFGQSPKIDSAESFYKINIPGASSRPHMQVFLLETREGRAFVFDVASGAKIVSESFKIPK